MALAGGVTGGVGEGGWERGWNPLTYKSLSIGQKTNTCQCTLSLSIQSDPSQSTEAGLDG